MKKKIKVKAIEVEKTPASDNQLQTEVKGATVKNLASKKVNAINASNLTNATIAAKVNAIKTAVKK